MNEKL